MVVPTEIVSDTMSLLRLLEDADEKSVESLFDSDDPDIFAENNVNILRLLAIICSCNILLLHSRSRIHVKLFETVFLRLFRRPVHRHDKLVKPNVRRLPPILCVLQLPYMNIRFGATV